MTADESVPSGIDLSRPSTARMYDYYLGGKDNFEVDREAAESVLAIAPEARYAARENRAFLQRAVSFLTTHVGIRQFIDIGTGLPTQGNVHEIAQEASPEARVVYVDNDPIVLAHSRALLSGTDNATAIQADMREPGEILDHPELPAFIDFAQPLGVIFAAVLHFVTDDENPTRLVTRFREAMAPGSYLVLSHASSGDRPDAASEAASVYRQATSSMTVRSPEEIGRLFDGFEFVEPGLVTTSEWRPDSDSPPATSPDPMAVLMAGVGRRT